MVLERKKEELLQEHGPSKKREAKYAKTPEAELQDHFPDASESHYNLILENKVRSISFGVML